MDNYLPAIIKATTVSGTWIRFNDYPIKNEFSEKRLRCVQKMKCLT